MTTEAKAVQRLSIQTLQGGRTIEEFTVEPGSSFLLITGNGYRTSVSPAQFRADTALADLGFGEGDPREAARRAERHENHVAAGRDINTGPYGRLYD